MDEDSSIFEKMNDTQFKMYCKFVFSILKYKTSGRLDRVDLFYFDSLIMDNMDRLKGPIARELTRLDIEYLFETFAQNDIDLYFNWEDTILQRPRLTFEGFDYIATETQTVKTTRTGKIPTYAKSGIHNQQYLFYIWNTDNAFDPWDWKVVGKDELDWQIDDEEFTKYRK